STGVGSAGSGSGIGLGPPSDPAAATWIENAGKAARSTPSLTLITTLAYAPTCSADGVPLSRPLVVSKLAHSGLFSMEKARGSPSGSAATGLRSYAAPTLTCAAGAALMVGARLPAPSPEPEPGAPLGLESGGVASAPPPPPPHPATMIVDVVSASRTPRRSQPVPPDFRIPQPLFVWPARRGGLAWREFPRA